MAVRVLLLVVFTGVFATAWSADGPAATTARLASKSQQLPERPSAADNNHRTLVVAEVGRAVAVSTELDVSIVVPPELIASGTYRVVDAQGRVGWMSIPVGSSPEHAGFEPQPVYSSETANGHWYFIRVEAAPIIASPPEATPVRM
ncbi:MAG: hypothetical protein FD138_2345 [Planctomycetota bacterium]|nr:MAG: hypothetical protein FD138_2345 [Planctomycetota bacterium]